MRCSRKNFVRATDNLLENVWHMWGDSLYVTNIVKRDCPITKIDSESAFLEGFYWVNDTLILLQVSGSIGES